MMNRRNFFSRALGLIAGAFVAPRTMIVPCEPIRWQTRLELEAVGLDCGDITPIDSITIHEAELINDCREWVAARYTKRDLSKYRCFSLDGKKVG